MFYAAFKQGKKYIQGIFEPQEFFDITFDPDTEFLYSTNFRAKSKEDAEEIAKQFYHFDALVVNNDGTMLSYSECAIICEKLERLARRFGLVRVFRENWII